MNLLHMKYAVEVARLGSLSRAAEVLLTAQPNISRAIKELECDLGITIFTRSQRGMVLTPDGEEFIGYAKELLRQMDELEQFYRTGGQKTRRFSLSAPRSCYISEAVTDFSCMLNDGPVELFFRETNTKETLDHVLAGDYRLGIVRCAAANDRSFKSMLEEKGLAYEMLSEFTYGLLMSSEHPLAEKEAITFDDLRPFMEIAHADPHVPALSFSKADRAERPDNISRRIFVFDRAGQFDLLAGNRETFMWASPISADVLARHGLVRRLCAQNHRVYKDLIIHREGYRYTQEDSQFITALCEARRRHFAD